MRAPWTALRDARAEIEAERDERSELLRLRRERIELRTAAVGAVALVVRYRRTKRDVELASERDESRVGPN